MNHSKAVVMKRNLPNRWWIDLPSYFFAVLIVQALLRSAGMGDFTSTANFSFARFAIWACCFYAVERVIKFALWAAVLVVAPERAREMP
jgi:hypothetical protein